MWCRVCGWFGEWEVGMIWGVYGMMRLRLKNFICRMSSNFVNLEYLFVALYKTFPISFYESAKSFLFPSRLKHTVLLGHTIKNSDIVTFTSRRWFYFLNKNDAVIHYLHIQNTNAS